MTEAGACYVLIFTGVGNLLFDVHGMAARIRAQQPGCAIDLRAWGVPLDSLGNLAAEERNRQTARARAVELAELIRAHPESRVVIIGYSGGGGMAVFVVESLPADVRIDRLVLIAPAISPDYPLAEKVLPHVREFLVNYASSLDLQVGLGTRTFGTMDRQPAFSAGCGGFNLTDPGLVQVHWSPAMVRTGHLGNHLGYLSATWQERYLLPALEPGRDAAGVAAALSPAAGG